MRDPDNMLSQQGWSPEFLSPANIETIRTEYEVLHLMRRCAQHFRFSHFLVARFPVGEQQRFAERLVVSNWPAELVRNYDALNLFHASRLVTETGMTKLPVQGGSALFAPVETVGGAPDAAAALAESHGLAASIAFLLHSTLSDPYLMVFSGRREALAGPELMELHFSALQLFECLEKTFATAATAGREKLSSREVECLRWAAAGKSSDEIAIILGISVYTVSSYFKSATRKLHAVNRMQAIAIALRLRLI